MNTEPMFVRSYFWNCRTLLRMHTSTCMCGALFDLRAAPPTIDIIPPPPQP